ncbi:MAG: type II secretion system F family protein [Acidimicrobiales bacterium]
MRLAVLSALCFGVGTTLLLSELRWFRRVPLADRLRPYAPARVEGGGHAGLLSVASFREVIGPVAQEIGARLATAFGIDEELGARLERVHSPMDPAAFRVRQLGWAIGTFAAGALLALGLGVPPLLGLLFIMGLPLLAFLILEQQLAAESARWQQTLFLELPVLAEQLGMLLSAGYSLGSALNRLATRGKGSCGRDLRIVTGRIRQGLGEVDALREWAARARVDGLDRLTAILALNREAGDLGRLISEEARGIRRDVHRQILETVERRGQTVWIPVTVATLVPGVLFLAVPFIEALRLFTQQ